jgi:predicted membrane protein
VLPFAAATAVQPAATGATTAAVVTSSWPAVLLSCGVFILCCAAAALLLSAIPLLWSLTRTTNRMESMLQVGFNTGYKTTPLAAMLFIADGQIMLLKLL